MIKDEWEDFGQINNPHYLEVYVSANSKSNDEKSKAEEKQRNCATVQLSLLARHFLELLPKRLWSFICKYQTLVCFPAEEWFEIDHMDNGKIGGHDSSSAPKIKPDCES